jgi:hypothetical protein
MEKSVYTAAMLKKTRPDGTLITGLPHFTRLLPYLMGSRTDSTIFFEQDFDITHALRFVKEKNQGSDGGQKRLTFFQVFLCAAVRTLALRPKLNRFVSGYNYYQRNRIIFNFVAKKELSDEGAEINITIPFSPEETLATLPQKVSSFVNRGKSGPSNESDSLNAFLAGLPRWMIRLVVGTLRFLDYHNMLPEAFISSMPFWASIFFTNVGSVGIDAPFHHNFNIGTCGFFIAMGKIRRECVTSESGSVELRDRVKVTFTYDDRITDGIYCGRAIELFRTFVENPGQLERPPELSASLHAELMLKG